MCQRSALALCGLLITLCWITGCAIPHSNTMVFATGTNVGLDVSANPTTGGAPTVNFGYRRQEGVWMPLLANKEGKGEGLPVPADCGDDCLFQGTQQKDTYSVLASFGLKFGASGEAQGVSANGDIAQYFATGLAAQTLAAAGGAQLVTVRPADTELAAAAKEQIDAENRAVENVLGYVNTEGNVDVAKLKTL